MSIISKSNEIRIVVAHPNKSLIRNDQSIYELYEAITGIDLLLDSMKE